MAKSLTFLLLYVGVMTGLNFPLGKLAGQAGVAPALWAMIISLGASLVLLPVLALRGRLIIPRGPMLRYVVLAGLITFVGANLLVFASIPHVGAGHVGIMFALSPVFTLGFSLLFGLRSPNALGIAGIGVGMIGACLVALGRGDLAGGSFWDFAALGIPVLLAIGNVYRTLDWPQHGDPELLAFWSHAVAATSFALLLIVGHGRLPLAPLGEVKSIAVVQMLVAGATFTAFFQLQRRGGPVLLSQIGYVAAATGMGTAVLFLGETYGPTTWSGAALIAVGVALTLSDQRGVSMKRLARRKPCAT